ncbi:MAG: hypothetical protein L3J06_06740 [Cyclobacteriaceae bacterium]|nr:hypothetical protein [Cyclobacteriaceae bacterium]
MKRILPLLFALPIVLSTSCSDNKSEEENIDIEKNPLGALIQMSKNIEKQAKEIENAEKRENVKAIHYEELIKYLPQSLDGYTAKEPDGGTIEMAEMSYSNAEITFTDKDNNQIHINLLDYNAALAMLTMTTAMWSSGLKIDTKDEFAQSINWSDNVSGWESYQKNNGNATLTLSIESRFLLTIEGDKQGNCDYLKEIAKLMDLDGLAALDEVINKDAP